MYVDAILYEANCKVLGDLEDMLNQIRTEDFCMISPFLKSSSIGQHCRHIIELYNCLLDQYADGIISYDMRIRDIKIETESYLALSHLKNIKMKIIKPDKSLLLIHELEGKDLSFVSSYCREVLYNIEHCIHHQALIKLASKELKYIQLSPTFGIAPATLAFQKKME